MESVDMDLRRFNLMDIMTALDHYHEAFIAALGTSPEGVFDVDQARTALEVAEAVDRGGLKNQVVEYLLDTYEDL
jgi:hypothetical protein